MKLLLLIFLFFLSSISVSAQIERKPLAIQTDSAQTTSNDNEDNKQSRKARLKDLDLTPEQKVKLKELREANIAAKAIIENNTQLSEPEKKKQLRELQKAQAQKIQAVLTAEQKSKIQSIQTKRSIKILIMG